jgi:hypothetical protein
MQDSVAASLQRDGFYAVVAAVAPPQMTLPQAQAVLGATRLVVLVEGEVCRLRLGLAARAPLAAVAWWRSLLGRPTLRS